MGNCEAAEEVWFDLCLLMSTLLPFFMLPSHFSPLFCVLMGRRVEMSLGAVLSLWWLVLLMI